MSIIGSLLVIAALIWAVAFAMRSPYYTGVNVPVGQPVPFSHAHHVGELGFDCRLCHTGAEVTSHAGMPSTKTCMTCHSQIWSDSPMLEPVRASWRTEVPLKWTRVHDLPDFTYFDHHVHLARGVGCTTCHGAVNGMPLMWTAVSLQMEWCLECHRAPERYLRPVDKVFDVEWTAPADQLEQGRKLASQMKIDTRQITNCSVCHR